MSRDTHPTPNVTKRADLHIHTHYSDSTSSPEEVIAQAREAGLSCIAITDHDTIDGIRPVRDAARGTDIEVIAGVELSTESGGKDVHILGYLFDDQNPALTKKLSAFQNARLERARQILEKLKSHGIDNISIEEVCSRSQSQAVGRPHIAALMVEKGWVKDIRKAFDKYLAEGQPGYVPKWKQTPSEALQLIREAGGVSVMAHPMITNKDALIPKLAEEGLDGLEVYYPNCPDNIRHYYEGIAGKLGLIMTGGSDAHGKAKNSTWLAKVTVPYTVVENLKTAAAKKG